MIQQVKLKEKQNKIDYLFIGNNFTWAQAKIHTCFNTVKHHNS